MELANLLFGGILGSIISTIIAIPLGVYFSQNLVSYRRYIKAIRELDMNKEHSFTLLSILLNKCIDCNPTCVLDISKFYKKLKLRNRGKSNNDNVSQLDIKRAIIYMNINSRNDVPR